MKQVVWTVALVSLMMVGGCIKPGAGATPEETLRNPVGALQAGDELAVVDCFKSSPAGKEALKIQCSSTKALLDFSAKMTTAYGAETIKHFGFGEDPFSALVNNVDQAKIVTSGDDHATATVPGWGAPIQLVKDAATMLWRVEGTRYIEMTEAQLNSGFRTTRHLRDAMLMVMNEIGTPGVTANTIVEKLEKHVMAELAKPAVPIHVPPAEPEPAPADPHASPTRPTLPDLPEPKLIDPHAPTTRPTLPDLPPPPTSSSLPELLTPRPMHTRGLRTPQQTLAMFAAALQSGDVAAMLRCHKANAEGQRAIRAMLPMMKVMIEFDAKMKLAYGKEGALFDDAGPQNIMNNAHKATIVVDGDTATATIPGELTKTKMVRENGAWIIIDEGISNATKAQVDPLLKEFGAVRSAMLKVMPEIGTPGNTAKTIAQKLQAAAKETLAP